MDAVSQLFDWKKIKVVIFDVDGTLYAQSKLRRLMLFDLMRFYLLRPWRLKELKTLQRFRSERENCDFESFTNLEEAQYTVCAEKQGVTPAEVKRITDKWIFTHPNQYLAQCTYPGVNSFFSFLQRQGIKVAIYSDYKAHDKLQAMNLAADLVVSSTDPFIDKFKPNPKGLHYVAEQLGVAPNECLFIGDRDEKDGLCARNAGMPYLIIGSETYPVDRCYDDLITQIGTNLKTPFYERDTLIS